MLVGPMRRDELRRAIELPAQRAGLRVKPELVERLDPERREVARRILLRLAEGEGDAVVGRRIPLAALEGEGVGETLAVLADARLVTLGEGGAEVAHEALFREWPRLRGWLEEDAAGRRVPARVTASARDWEAVGAIPGRSSAAPGWPLPSTGPRATTRSSPGSSEFLAPSRSAGERSSAACARASRASRRSSRRLAAGVVALARVARRPGGSAAHGAAARPRALTEEASTARCCSPAGDRARQQCADPR